MTRLTHYGEGAEGTRRRARVDELVTPRFPQERLEPVIDRLADARLLVTRGGREGAGRAPQRPPSRSPTRP